jgi:hypothetical protein
METEKFRGEPPPQGSAMARRTLRVPLNRWPERNLWTAAKNGKFGPKPCQAFFAKYSLFLYGSFQAE